MENMATIFDRFAGNLALDKEHSASGPGSDLRNTRMLPGILRKVIMNYDIKSVLDAPCGDLHWMRHIVDKLGVRYTGMDVVPRLVARNKTFFPKHWFIQGDITSDPLPLTDLIFCRDCLVHLCEADIHAALANFKASGSRYLLTTTFTRDRKFVDIQTGGWRPINLELAPFNLHVMEAFNEEYADPAFADKSLGLFDLSKI